MKSIKIRPNNSIFSQMGIRDIEIVDITFSERNRKIVFSCILPTPNKLDELNIIYENLKRNFGDSLDIDFNVDIKNKEITTHDLKYIIEKAINFLKLKNAISRSFLYFYKINIDDKIQILLGDKPSIDILYQSNINEKLEEIINRFGVHNYKVEFILGDLNKEMSELERLKEEEIISLASKIDSENKRIAQDNLNNPKQKQNENNNNFNKGEYKPRRSANLLKDIKGKSISMKEFFELYENDNCVLEGEIFSTEIREIRNDRIIGTIRITDGNEAVTTKYFGEKGKALEFKTGDFVKVSGRKQIDNYANNEEIIMLNAINKMDIEKEEKVDDAEVKMVELHAHTKMSEMVGVAEAKEIVKKAMDYGHKAVAITDYSVAHSFPLAYKETKKKDFKAIFGCEIYMVDDEAIMVRNPKDKNIEDEEFVVFDLETMGLNSHEHEIIEIGAVKLRGKSIVDRFSYLVNPKKKIPQKIQELTNITQSMVDNEPTIEEVLPKFIEFVGDATLVAHNAAFDMGFIYRDVKKYLGYDYNPSVIDTLQMARDLYPDLKSFGLKNMNKVLGLSLESHHRAVDDSQATANMFIIFLERYLEKGITNMKDITKAFPINTQKQDTRNVMVLVKNLEGLKNLYRLISMAHVVDYGNKKPRVLKSHLKEYREGLIIGSSLTSHFLNAGELSEYYMRYDLESIEKNIDFYDYIELLPKEAYSELIESENTGTISSFEMIKDMNRYFYDLAKKHDKIVTASSNVHYIDEEDARIRSILLYGSGLVFRKNQYMTDNKFYFRTTNELLEEFSYLGEEVSREIVVKNTNMIADMIEKIQPVPDGFYPPKIDNAENIVKEMTYKKAHRIYGDKLPEIVEKRLERELKAIIGNGFSVLYLSAQKLVKKSLDNGYLVGSRGSVGSSLVAYMMDITEVNALYPHYICTNPQCKHSEFIEQEGVGIDLPEKDCPKCGKKLKRDGYSIPFEVFMGFNGDKVPDIDLNFSGEYQSEIHRYTEELFGKENVFKAGTISTLAEKNAQGYVKKFVEEHDFHTTQANIIRLAKKVEGAKKTTGQHPGGMVVVPSDHSIYEFCPVQKPANDMKNDSITTHFDYHVMDEQLVKLDILGHDDPTTIKMLQESTGLAIEDIPLSDPDTLKIFSSTESLGVTPEEINGSTVGTFGVPEFGTPFVRQMLVDTKPTTFAELVRISGLSHGTDVWLNNAQEYVRAGIATLPEVISVRDDIMNYLIDQGIEKLTAFKIMEFVRKGKPTKDPEQWEEYSKLLKEKNVAEWYIESCGKIKYMFPKGHAVAYVMMAMRIAYFKVHYPLDFYAAYLSRKALDFDYDLMSSPEKAKEHLELLSKEPKLDVKKKAEMTLCEIILEMYARNIEFLSVDVYKSASNKFIIEDGKIRMPLIAVGGLGEAVADKVTKEREIGKFISYEDLKKRTGVSQTIMDKLKSIGAIENLSETNQISMF